MCQQINLVVSISFFIPLSDSREEMLRSGRWLVMCSNIPNTDQSITSPAFFHHVPSTQVKMSSSMKNAKILCFKDILWVCVSVVIRP